VRQLADFGKAVHFLPWVESPLFGLVEPKVAASLRAEVPVDDLAHMRVQPVSGLFDFGFEHGVHRRDLTTEGTESTEDATEGEKAKELLATDGAQMNTDKKTRKRKDVQT
jgi:hypothetical protein